jgi:putative RecB family exonuclease
MEGALKLSPSSAADFKSCAQLFKFRDIDHLPEPVSPAAARGSLVHVVLQQLFAEDPSRRTAERADELLVASWSETRGDPRLDLDGILDPLESLDEPRELLRNYFKLEDPRAVRATKLEWWVEYEFPELHLRGVIDRLEEQPDGSWILTDYKTGRIPGPTRELRAFFGLRFYALICWRAFGVIPREIRLVFLADPAVLSLTPHPRMLVAFERQVHALGAAVRRALATGDWRARPSPFCMWCSFQDRCPAWAAVANRPEA